MKPDALWAELNTHWPAEDQLPFVAAVLQRILNPLVLYMQVSTVVLPLLLSAEPAPPPGTPLSIRSTGPSSALSHHRRTLAWTC